LVTVIQAADVERHHARDPQGIDTPLVLAIEELVERAIGEGLRRLHLTAHGKPFPDGPGNFREQCMTVSSSKAE
jgi:hypothetical protein